MKTLLSILKNLRNLIPYLLLIGVYFFLVNIEATRDKDINKENEISNNEANINKKEERVNIPVIPYKR